MIQYKPAQARDRLGWRGLQAAHFGETPTAELKQPVLTYHMLVLFARPPEKFDFLKVLLTSFQLITKVSVAPYELG